MEGSYFLIFVNVEILILPAEYMFFLMQQRVIGATLCQDGLETVLPTLDNCLTIPLLFLDPSSRKESYWTLEILYHNTLYHLSESL